MSAVGEAVFGMDMWDTSGQERFRSGANTIFLCYDRSSPVDSRLAPLSNIESWLEKLTGDQASSLGVNDPIELFITRY
jgi:GTPase SAR1 family protein